MRLADQALLKRVTRLFMEGFGDAYPEVVVTLKAAWNNDDNQLHEAAWESLQRIGKVNVEHLMMHAKNDLRTNDWMSQHLPSSVDRT